MTTYEHLIKMFIDRLYGNIRDKEDHMGRAFTEEERADVQERLRRTGLKLLAENGIRNISIRQLTAEAGISQGGFYTFYKDKDDFVEDLFLLRIREKTDLMLAVKEDTLSDPRKFIVELLYKEGMHLKENKAFVNSESDTIRFFMNNRNRKGEEIYRAFLTEMISWWEENGFRIECDVDKLMSVGIAAGVLFSNAELVKEDHFSEIYRTFCEAETDRFFQCKKRS